MRLRIRIEIRKAHETPKTRKHGEAKTEDIWLSSDEDKLVLHIYAGRDAIVMYRTELLVQIVRDILQDNHDLTF
jgi:hypothetical protein